VKESQVKDFLMVLGNASFVRSAGGLPGFADGYLRE
jgi:hypothetical protein